MRILSFVVLVAFAMAGCSPSNKIDKPSDTVVPPKKGDAIGGGFSGGGSKATTPAK